MYLRKYFRRKAYLIFFFILLCGFVGGVVLTGIGFLKKIEPAEATYFNTTTQTGDNVSGFAWSPNMGWISFNSSDCDLNGDGKFGDVGAPAGCPPLSVTFHDYGVNVETNTGQFKGYAWSNNLGWIYFGPDANLSGFGNVTEASAPGDPKNWAKYDFKTEQVNGWAKALSLGDNGWIKMTGTWTSGVKINPLTTEFTGFAWNGNSDGSSIGWISFNCKDMPKTCSGGSNPGTLCPTGMECLGVGSACVDSCTLANYKVTGNVNQIPKATELEAPYLSNEKLCEEGVGVRSAILKWKFVDLDINSSESAYQIIFNDKNEITNPLIDTHQCTNTLLADCIVPPGVDKFPISDLLKKYAVEYPEKQIKYGGHYYWWVRVWDNNNAPSAWESGSAWGADFIIPGHEFPKAKISNKYTPALPHAGEQIKFTGSSSIYKFGAPGVPVSCMNDKVNCWWYWSVTPFVYSNVNDPYATSPLIKYSNPDQEFHVNLEVTDADHYSCTSTLDISAYIGLPKWIEVKDKKN